ncbi:MAG: putative flap endonuclease-1-like 5' DNA nuclease [Paraglaciecola sp.]|jgi:predicted flap endonuclease-1-like 5' DNA nuclease
MAKKNQNTSKKKVKNDPSDGDSILEEINSKLKSGQKDLQKQVDELTAQVKNLSNDPSKTARKFIKVIEKSYHKKLAQLQKDFDKRMVAVHKLQDKVIAHLPTELAERLHLKTNSPTKSVKKPSKAAKTPVVKINKRGTVKPETVTVARAPKKPTIASINGIGPVTHKKLVEAGFTSLEDLANTPASKTEALKQFEKTKGFNTWQKEAQALLNKK